MATPEWTVEAACLGKDPSIFFVEEVQGRKKKKIRKAKRICLDCAVTAQCLDYAIKNNFEEGIFGGMTAEERLTIRPFPVLDGGA